MGRKKKLIKPLDLTFQQIVKKVAKHTPKNSIVNKAKAKSVQAKKTKTASKKKST